MATTRIAQEVAASTSSRVHGPGRRPRAATSRPPTDMREAADPEARGPAGDEDRRAGLLAGGGQGARDALVNMTYPELYTAFQQGSSTQCSGSTPDSSVQAVRSREVPHHARPLRRRRLDLLQHGVVRQAVARPAEDLLRPRSRWDSGSKVTGSTSPQGRRDVQSGGRRDDHAAAGGAEEVPRSAAAGGRRVGGRAREGDGFPAEAMLADIQAAIRQVRRR